MKKMKQLYLDSMIEFKQTRTMVFFGLMAAIGVVLSYTTTVDIGPYMKIGFTELPNRVIDFIFGPIIGGLFGGVLDTIKYIVKPTGPFIIGFTISEVLSGVIYGTFLYKKPLKVWRVVAAELTVKLFVNCVLNTLWLTMLYGKSFSVLLPARVLKNLIMLPIDSVVVFFLLLYAQRIILPLFSDKRTYKKLD